MCSLAGRTGSQQSDLPTLLAGDMPGDHQADPEAVLHFGGERQ